MPVSQYQVPFINMILGQYQVPFINMLVSRMHLRCILDRSTWLWTEIWGFGKNDAWGWVMGPLPLASLAIWIWWLDCVSDAASIVQLDCGLGIGPRGKWITSDWIRKDSFVTEYSGDVFHRNSKILKAREEFYNINSQSYLLNIPNSPYTIDATQYGSFGRYLNHSCRANCKV